MRNTHAVFMYIFRLSRNVFNFQLVDELRAQCLFKFHLVIPIRGVAGHREQWIFSGRVLLHLLWVFVCWSQRSNVNVDYRKYWTTQKYHTIADFSIDIVFHLNWPEFVTRTPQYKSYMIYWEILFLRSKKTTQTDIYVLRRDEFFKTWGIGASYICSFACLFIHLQMSRNWAELSAERHENYFGINSSHMPSNVKMAKRYSFGSVGSFICPFQMWNKK